MNNNLQLVLKSSTTEMSLNDHDAGIYIVPELDGLTGLPEIRTTSGVNAGYDGGWTSAQKFDARSIVIRGVIANEDKTEVERKRRELVALLAQGKNEQLELDFVTETGRAYEVQVRTIACDMAMQRVLTQQEFMITLRADDPLIYDNSSAGEEATVNVSGATGGFRIPFEIPLAIDAGSEETVVQNSGLESVAPTIKMYGALHNPKIINHTTNQAMQVEAELGFTEGAWTTPVDAPEGTNVSFEPEREAPIESAKLKGDTYQQTYTGKNLLPLEGSTSEKGLTISRNTATGALEFGGTTTGTWPWLNNSDVSLPAGTYTFSIDHALPYNLTLRLYETSSSYPKSVSIPAGSTSGTSTTTYPIVYLAMLYGVTSTGVQVPTTTIYPMLESGSTATTPFEPYTNGPAPNPDYPQAVQTVTGENVVQVCGKNLLKMPIVSGSSNGITWTVQDDGSIILNGTSTAGVNIRANNVTLPAVEGETYTLSATGMGEAYNFGYKNSGSGENIFVVTSASPTTTAVVTSTMLSQANRLDMYIQSGKTFNNQRVTLQLEKGSSASSFEPYQSQSYVVNLGDDTLLLPDGTFTNSGVSAAIGKNTIVVNRTSSNSNTSFIRVDLEKPITIHAGDTFTLYAENYQTIGATSSDNAYMSIRMGAGSDDATTDVFLGSANARTTINAAEDKTYTRFVVRTASSLSPSNFLIEPKLIINGQDKSIELCKIGDYQDYIYKSDDKWYVHKEVEHSIKDVDINGIAANNTAGTTVQSGNGAFQLFFNQGTDIPTSDVDNVRLSANLGTYNTTQTISGNADAQTMTNGTFKTRSGTPDRLYFRNTAYIGKTGNEVKALLLQNVGGSDFWWFKATPTDTEITNEALIAQLEALVDGNAVVYEGETNIAITAAVGNMPGIAAIRYYTDKEPDQRDELIIDSRLKTITLNGLDVYHLQAPGSEFLMLAPGENKLSLQSDITGDNGYAKVSYKQGYLSI